MSDDKNARVIDFPADKIAKRRSTDRQRASQEEPKFQWTLPLKFLAGVVAGVTVINFVISNYGSFSKSSPARGLASTETSTYQLRDFEVEKNISTAISDLSSRDLASIGRRPTTEDRLLYETLQGRYNIRKIKGKVNHLKFTSDVEGPLTIEDRRDFLESHRHLFPGSDQRIQNSTREVLPHRILESYDLISTDKEVARVYFELDLQERLISLKVERNRNNGL